MLFFIPDVEYWIESDDEIDEDITIEGSHIPPPEMELEGSEGNLHRTNITIRWIVMLLSVFQTHFYLTKRALCWLLNFLFILFRYFGRFSSDMAELGLAFPQSLHQYEAVVSNIIPNSIFEKRAVCTNCQSIYKFEECVRKCGTRYEVMRCKSKSFNKTCNHLLMREIRTSNGTAKFYLSS